MHGEGTTYNNTQHTDGHCDYQTDPAQRAKSVKKNMIGSKVTAMKSGVSQMGGFCLMGELPWRGSATKEATPSSESIMYHILPRSFQLIHYSEFETSNFQSKQCLEIVNYTKVPKRMSSLRTSMYLIWHIYWASCSGLDWQVALKNTLQHHWQIYQHIYIRIEPGRP